MNKLIIIAIYSFILSLQSCNKSNPPLFTIIRYNLTIPKDSLAFENWKITNQITPNQTIKEKLLLTDGSIAGELFYEDYEYKVYANCNGEFGGSLYFQEKNNPNSIYYLESVCPVMMEKRKDGYYIVESLTHMSGSGKVSFIKSPKELIHLDLNNLTADWQSKKFPNLSYYERYDSLHNQGTFIVGGYGITFDMFFEFKDKNYAIYSMNEKTIIGVLNSDTLLPIDTLFHLGSYRPIKDYKYTAKNHKHYEFEQNHISIGDNTVETNKVYGEIYVRNDSIVCAYSHRYWTKEKN